MAANRALSRRVNNTKKSYRYFVTIDDKSYFENL